MQVVGGGGFSRRASWLVFCRFFARLRRRRVFVRPSCFRAILPRFRACFWRLRVWRCVVRFAVSILTPFLAVSRLVSARLVYSVKAIKKPQKRAIFKAFCVRGDAVKGKGKKDNKKTGVRPVFRFIFSFSFAFVLRCIVYNLLRYSQAFLICF